MKGILLLSHGPLAKGMFETTKWFMGDDIPQYSYLGLMEGESMEDFDERIKAEVKKLDSGEGCIIFCDLTGGSPFNRSCFVVNEIGADKVQIISGMNLSMVLEQLGNRLSDVYDFDTLVETAREGIQDVNKMMF